MRCARICVHSSLCAAIIFAAAATHTFAQTPSKSKAATIAALENQADALYKQDKPESFAAAFPLYLKAASLGSAHAMNEISVMYLLGAGVTSNDKRALAWSERAAAEGNADAEYTLGTFYQKGIGIDVDLAQAEAWYRRAAAQGEPRAIQALAQITAPTPAAQPVPAPQQAVSSDSSQPASSYQNCAVVSYRTVNLNGINNNTLVQLGNSCNFPINTVAVSTAHRVLNSRAANDPGGGIGWSSTANGDPFIYVCPDPFLPVDANGNLPTAPNQTIYCKQVTLTGRQEY